MSRSWSSILLFVVYLGCQSSPSWPSIKKRIRTEFPEVTTVTAEELQAKLGEPDGAKPVLLDVREAEEYAVSHLPGAIHVPPGSDASETLGATSKDAPIVTYCAVGYRSSELAKRLMEQGYTHVVNLEGSIFEWANKGYPVVRDGTPVDEVHPYDAEWGRLLDPELHAYEPADR